MTMMRTKIKMQTRMKNKDERTKRTRRDEGEDKV